MTDPGPATVEDAMTINADPHTVYHLITDLPTLASLAEEAEENWGDGVIAKWLVWTAAARFSF
jgi:hypothetical protein